MFLCLAGGATQRPELHLLPPGRYEAVRTDENCVSADGGERLDTCSQALVMKFKLFSSLLEKMEFQESTKFQVIESLSFCRKRKITFNVVLF